MTHEHDKTFQYYYVHGQCVGIGSSRYEKVIEKWRQEDIKHLTEERNKKEKKTDNRHWKLTLIQRPNALKRITERAIKMNEEKGREKFLYYLNRYQEAANNKRETNRQVPEEEIRQLLTKTKIEEKQTEKVVTDSDFNAENNTETDSETSVKKLKPKSESEKQKFSKSF